MRLRGGYNVLLQGRPDARIEILPEPQKLIVPLSSRRFNFSDIRVQDGQKIDGGDILAQDPENYNVPLLASRAGVVRLDPEKNHIVLENISKTEFAHAAQGDLPHIVRQMGKAGINRYKLLSLGAWQFIYDAYTGKLPDPLGKPQAVIVSTLSLEPFSARGDVQLKKRLLSFTRGLEHLQSLLEYQTIYLVMPKVESDIEKRVYQNIRGYAWAKVIEIPQRYPFDDFNILARFIGLKKDSGPVWSLRTEGVLAIDRALTLSKPSLVRIISIGGPEVDRCVHLKAMSGYPVNAILDKHASDPDVRVINGGILTGRTIEDKTLGLDTECRGLTILPKHTEREFLGFVRPGWDRSCYAECFLSSFRKKFKERYTTAMRGEGRPCVSCNFCEEVCPAGIMPHLIHKYLYSDLIEEADEARIDLCIRCGLCSFVCPSKIELTQQFADAQVMIEEEKEQIRAEQLRKEKLHEEELASRQTSEERS